MTINGNGFDECADCARRSNKAICDTCECGEFFEEESERSPLAFDDESTDDFDFLNNYELDNEQNY